MWRGGGSASTFIVTWFVVKVSANVGLLVCEGNTYEELASIPLYIPQLYFQWTLGPWNFLVLSRCGEDTLASYITKNSDPMSDPMIREGVHRLLATLAYFHEAGFVHCDIKPENICVNKEGREWHLIDLGSTVNTDRRGQPNAESSSYSPKYLPPEYILQKTHDDTPMRDVYALGIIVCELYGQCTPFQDEHEYWRKLTIGKELHNNFPDIVNRGSREHPILPSSMPSDLQPIVRKMLNCDPTNRYQTAREAYDDALEALRATT